MIKTKLCFAARAISMDRDTDDLSVFSVFDEVEAQLPLFIQQCVFVCLNKREPADPETYDAELIVKLNGDPLMRNSLRVDFRGTRTNRSVWRINGLVLPHPGTLLFTVDIGDRELCSYSVPVLQRPAAVQEQAAAGERS